MDFDIDEITQDDGYIHIFGDASVSPKTKMLGVAWLIATKTPENPIENLSAEDLPEDEDDYATRMHSTLGEFAAVAIALSNMPPNLKLRMHTDNKAVLALAGHAIRTHNMPNNSLKEVYKPILRKIIEAAKKQEHVSLEYAQDNEDKEPSSLKRYYMARAHNLAADGSGANSHIELPDPYTPDQPKKPIKELHDSSKAMDVIEPEDGDIVEPFEYGSTPKNKPTGP
tara:strand:- start:35 stop:712 length:678 start_codon:yes stop_codon:yes gene_type:complete